MGPSSHLNSHTHLNFNRYHFQFVFEPNSEAFEGYSQLCACGGEEGVSFLMVFGEPCDADDRNLAPYSINLAPLSQIATKIHLTGHLSKEAQEPRKKRV